MKRFIGLALPIIAMMGCNTYPDEYQVYISPRFSTSDQNVIIADAQAWEKQVPVRLVIHISEYDCAAHSNDICIVPSTMAIIYSEAQAPNVVGWTHYYAFNDESLIKMAMDFFSYKSEEEFRVSVMHELGHGQGLKHSVNGSLMSTTYEHQAHNITCNDIVQWYKVRGRIYQGCQ